MRCRSIHSFAVALVVVLQIKSQVVVLALLSSCRACTLQDAAMLMLDDDEEFWRDEYDEPVKAPNTTAGQDAAVRPKPAPGRETRGPGREARAPDVNLDKYLAGMPGVEGMLPESEMLDEMLVSDLHTHTLFTPGNRV